VFLIGSKLFTARLQGNNRKVALATDVCGYTVSLTVHCNDHYFALVTLVCRHIVITVNFLAAQYNNLSLSFYRYIHHNYSELCTMLEGASTLDLRTSWLQ
jgi:hypothetical protein